MSHSDDIPPEWLQRNPLITAAGMQNLNRLLQHPDAPRWNFATGDRLIEGDLEVVDEFRREVFSRDQQPSTQTVPPDALLQWVRSMRTRSWLFRDRIPSGLDLESDWSEIPTMSREDLATRIEEVVPFDIDDFSRFICYDTSGTTGHAVPLPYHPLTVAKHHPLAEFALQAHGATLIGGPDSVACVNVCAQASTYVFANVFSVWEDAGFAKVNLNDDDWAGGREAARRYLADLAPEFISSDPISLAEMLSWEITVRPKAILSTAVTLTPEFRAVLAREFQCPVIDWYSTSETGPIAFSAPDGEGYLLLPHDIFVETLDDRGHPTREGEVGELTITGGRNPYIPLLRYRTGDYGRLVREPEPRLFDLQGRAPIFFRSADGDLINAVDIGRTMRLTSVFAQHQFVQRLDDTCRVTVRPVPGVPVDTATLRHGLRELFGDLEIDVVVDTTLGLGGEKVVCYQREEEQ